MKRLIFSAVMLLVTFVLPAQPNYWAWATQAGGYFDDYGKAIATDNQGNQYVTGFIGSEAYFGMFNLSVRGMFVAKLDPDGNVLWAVDTNGPGDSCGFGIDVDSVGNVYVAGFIEGTLSFGSNVLTSYGGRDVFIAKLDSAGNFLWATQAGSANDDWGLALAVDGQSHASITGCITGPAAFGPFNLAGGPSWDAFVARLDPDGNFLWAKRAGSSSNDVGNGVATDNQANVYFTGSYQGPASFGPINLTCSGSSDLFAAKLDSAGNWLWVAVPQVRAQRKAMPLPLIREGMSILPGCSTPMPRLAVQNSTVGAIRMW